MSNDESKESQKNNVILFAVLILGGIML